MSTSRVIALEPVLNIPVAASRPLLSESLAGFLCGMPICWPGPPWHWGAIGAACILLPSAFARSRREDQSYACAIIVFIFMACLSCAVSPALNEIRPAGLVNSAASAALLILGFGVRDIDTFLSGFRNAVLCLAVAVIAYFFYSGTYRDGLNYFVFAEGRMWGADVLPAWPNFLCIVLSLGFLAYSRLPGRKYAMGLCLLAAILTTSRMAWLAIAVYAIQKISLKTVVSILGVIFMIVCGAAAVTVALSLSGVLSDSELIERFLFRTGRVSDRQIIFLHLIQLWLERPLLGWGAIDAHFHADHEFFAAQDFMSFHNSFLDVLVRGGIVGFVIFAYLLMPRRRADPASPCYRDRRALMAYILLASMFQNVFKHPCLAITYAILLQSGISAPRSSRRPPQRVATDAMRDSRCRPPKRPPNHRICQP